MPSCRTSKNSRKTGRSELKDVARWAVQLINAPIICHDS